MVKVKVTKAQAAAIFYDVEAMIEDAQREDTKTSPSILRIWPVIEKAAKTGKPAELDRHDARWLYSVVLENIIDIGNDHAQDGDRAAMGRVRCTRNLMVEIKRAEHSGRVEKHFLATGKTLNETAKGLIELKRHGSDEPICPSCGHNNAMLCENPAKSTYKCRDCGFTCVSVCFVNLDSKVNRA